MTGEEIKNAIRGKGLSMEDAAHRLGMNRTTLYHKLNAATIDKEFLQNVQDLLGLNLLAPERNLKTAGMPEKIVDNIPMRYNVVPLKNDRFCEIWIPKDFKKDDLDALNKWIELKELTL